MGDKTDLAYINDDQQDLINRISRAMDRGTGCYLTPEMVRSLTGTIIDEWRAQQDPRGQMSPERKGQNDADT